MAWWHELQWTASTREYPGIPDPGPGQLRGRPLRYFLTLRLHESATFGAPSMTVAELVRECEAAGVVFTDRPSKTVSDALRWEVRNGRVRRVGRGRYTSGHIPPSTLSWIRRRVQLSLTRIRLELDEASSHAA